MYAITQCHKNFADSLFLKMHGTLPPTLTFYDKAAHLIFSIKLLQITNHTMVSIFKVLVNSKLVLNTINSYDDQIKYKLHLKYIFFRDACLK